MSSVKSTDAVGYEPESPASRPDRDSCWGLNTATSRSTISSNVLSDLIFNGNDASTIIFRCSRDLRVSPQKNIVFLLHRIVTSNDACRAEQIAFVGV